MVAKILVVEDELVGQQRPQFPCELGAPQFVGAPYSPQAIAPLEEAIGDQLHLVASDL